MIENILKNSHQEISSIITEPILWNTNVILPEDGYLEKLRLLCDKYNILKK